MTLASALLPLDIALGVIVYWLLLGLAGLFSRNSHFITRYIFPAAALGSLVLAAAALFSLGGPANIAVLPLGLPDLPFHLRLDALSAFFLLLLGAASTGISIYAAGYFRHMSGATLGLLCFEYHLFLLGMALVFIADDAYLFMVAWETMALSSYFLVTTDHAVPEIRRAGFLYLLIAHVGAIAILMSFGVMQGGHGDYTFATMRGAQLDTFWASITFLLALFGFGAKAGILPLHVWLPEAHPAAPSPISAMMSGIMLKTAIYGILRVSFDLLDMQLWWWGAIALTLGLVTALFGVLFAAVQSDMKRLLAYSSIENIGIILVGIGLAIIFHSFGKEALAALALTAALYHSLNHSFMKSLLFLGTGSVLHATGERNLGKLGGLIRRMPKLALLVLVGTLALAGLPPLNGFVSEWLLLQAFLLSPGLPNSYLNMLVPIAAAALALAAALAAYVMVKFYGIIFLGQPREANLVEKAQDIGTHEWLGLAWLALGCIVLGIFPVYIITQIDHITQMLVGQHLGGAMQNGWMWLTPIQADRASYNPLILIGTIVLGVLFTLYMVKKFYHRRLRRSAAWDCGYPEQTARMQDTAEGFGQPIRQIFDLFFGVTREVPSPFDKKPHYRGETRDLLWEWCYLPIAALTEKISALVGRLQHGRIHIYLLYSFVTLLALLAFVR
ncbi:MAG TPA: hydrogenase 4 subunit B [Gallionellaceae bacterium]|nr:hydrogenase 4 subunit B [Gallionellaceae bacterium]HQS74162.1 hydrogenase 4 subunit B [Gallionellaceae bacterium]